MSFVLRQATAGDAEAIAAVHIAAWEETYAGLLPEEMWRGQNLERRALNWRNLISRGQTTAGSAVLVAMNRDDVIGFGCCHPQRDSSLRDAGYVGETGAIYVLRASQGIGVGRALMRDMVTHLRAAGLCSMALWVLRENVRARGFYERLGGAIIATKDDQRGAFTLTELAYGWRDVDALNQAKHPSN